MLSFCFVAACADRGATVRLTIRKGSPFREAADSLSAHGVVSSSRLFRVYAKLRGRDVQLRYGTYVLRKGMSWNEVLDALKNGRGIVHQVTIPEGYTIAQMEPLLIDALDITHDSLDVAVRDSALRHMLDVPTPMLEGYLFPDTYTFAEGTTAREAVRIMVERFEKEWKPAYEEKRKALPVVMSRHDVITLASIVEKEVRRREEGPVVAAVYLNRLKARIPLQADPTVQYALGRKPSRVYFKDLRVDSPYNTYRNPGLPPGPIASPGGASILAALSPAKVPFRYFVAHPDGHHEFRRTYEEHLEAIRMVRSTARSDSIARDAAMRKLARDSALKAVMAPVPVKDTTKP